MQFFLKVILTPLIYLVMITLVGLLKLVDEPMIAHEIYRKFV